MSWDTWELETTQEDEENCLGVGIGKKCLKLFIVDHLKTWASGSKLEKLSIKF